MLSLALLALAVGQADGQKHEAAHLRHIRQVTHHFVRAGEGYFSPDGKKIIFQAEEKRTDNPFYQIFIMDLTTGKSQRVSPGTGRTTCSFFRPDGKKIIFASSHADPAARQHQREEYERRENEKNNPQRRRYQWDFDPYYDIYEANPDGTGLKNLTHSPGYDAEGSYSPDGKQIVFCSNRDGNLQLYIMDADGGHVRQLTHAPHCYNGGPFFSPDGKQVIFRSDRKRKDFLQIYVINADGTGERALTNEPTRVNWAPYWYKDGKHIIYGSADYANPAGGHNFDLWWMNVATGKKTRITFDPAADVLPVFSPDGSKLMWTSRRNGLPEAQLFIADFTPPTDARAAVPPGRPTAASAVGISTPSSSPAATASTSGR